MVISHIDNFGVELDKFSEAIKKALNWIQNADFNSLENKKYEIDGENIQVILSEYTTKSPVDCKSESHKKMIDIQYIIKGEEMIQIGFPFNENVFQTDYDDAKDRWFYDRVVFEKNYIFTQGMFCILYPTDIHRPGCMSKTASNVRKAVVKISIDSL